MGKGLTTVTFIAKAREVHDKKYDYSQSAYRKANTKIRIICPTHGAFEQRADHHLRGHGCIRCAGKAGSNTKDFVELFTAISTTTHRQPTATPIARLRSSALSMGRSRNAQLIIYTSGVDAPRAVAARNSPPLTSSPRHNGCTGISMTIQEWHT